MIVFEAVVSPVMFTIIEPITADFTDTSTIEWAVMSDATILSDIDVLDDY